MTNSYNSSPAYIFSKRAFDIVVSSLLLMLLSPVLILIAILIKLESPGPVFYISRRVGQHYRVFNFYKFRSMRSDADALLKKMKHLNHYGAADNGTEKIEPVTNALEVPYAGALISDEGWVVEDQWLAVQDDETKKAFVKFSNDPRITRVGKFIRNTSIDELPQLINVLIGDMSLVGNRPLPLYEAEKLTTDEAVGRFLAPAGITGLWQVTERGKAKTSADSRKQLDVEYAQKCNFWLDMWILFRTPLAALQSENV